MRLRVFQLIAVCLLAAQSFGQGELHFCLHSDPKLYGDDANHLTIAPEQCSFDDQRFG